MSVIAFNDIDAAPRASRQPGLAGWIAASVAVHVLIIIWILTQIAPDWLTLSDHDSQDRRPVEMVQLQAPPAVAHMQTPTPTADQPRLELPPVHRSTNPAIQTMDAATMMRLLNQQATSQDRTQDGGAGFSWSTCSLMSPEQRAMMPACDGQMLAAHRVGNSVAVSLEAPDGATLELVKKFEKEAAAKALTAPGHADDKNKDRSYRDPSDDRYGPKPWE